MTSGRHLALGPGRECSATYFELGQTCRSVGNIGRRRRGAGGRGACRIAGWRYAARWHARLAAVLPADPRLVPASQ